MTPARVAAALGVGRSVVLGIARVPDVQTSVAREELPVARVAGGKHAVEHVHAAVYAFDQVLGRAHSHQVARLSSGQAPAGLRNDLVHQIDRFSDAESADRISLETQSLRRVGARAPEIRENPALHDAE